MDDSAVRATVLQILARWDRLPESDLLQRLAPLERLHWRAELLYALARDGLVVVREVGDERVLSITESGRGGAPSLGQGL